MQIGKKVLFIHQLHHHEKSRKKKQSHNLLALYDSLKLRYVIPEGWNHFGIVRYRHEKLLQRKNVKDISEVVKTAFKLWEVNRVFTFTAVKYNYLPVINLQNLLLFF